MLWCVALEGAGIDIDPVPVNEEPYGPCRVVNVNTHT